MKIFLFPINITTRLGTASNKNVFLTGYVSGDITFTCLQISFINSFSRCWEKMKIVPFLTLLTFNKSFSFSLRDKKMVCIKPMICETRFEFLNKISKAFDSEFDANFYLDNKIANNEILHADVTLLAESNFNKRFPRR